MSYFPPHPNLMLRGSHGSFLMIPAGQQAPGLQRFAAFSGGLGFTAGALQFDAALQAAGRDGGMLAIRGFYNQWRFGDAASFTDLDLLKLLRRDVRAGFLATFYLPDEAFAGFTLTGDYGQAVPAPSGPVSGWSLKQKLVAMFEAVPDYLAGAAKAEFLAFISPVNLAIMAGILVTIAGVQAIPGADAFVDGLIIALAWAQFGWAGLLAARDFVQAVAQAGQAKSDDDIKLAAKLAAAALVSLGLVAFLKKLTGKVRQSGGLKNGEEKAKPPPQEKTKASDRNPAPRTAKPPVASPKLRQGLSSNWFDPDTGKLIWPPDDGFAGPKSDVTLPINTEIDRYGSEYGRFLSPAGASYASRALPYDPTSIAYHVYQVTKPLPVVSGTAASWFDEVGGGTQYMTSKSVQQLIDEGFLKEIIP